jgi:2-polyprenyl-3-methyl-5-hydroxy-6-metoxy-1,4-benzoquinol methylase
MWQCADCRTAYLDPRPSQASIHLAYTRYYTHKAVNKGDDYSSLNLARRLRRRFVNGYTNWRYATRAEPSSSLGILVAFALPNLKKLLDSRYRHMPHPPKVGGALLDVGCGDGAFLDIAHSCGWETVGLDPDALAVSNAVERGLRVYEGGIEYFEGKEELFDVITLSHVIEHVHQPTRALRTCFSLLKPKGQLWLATPNVDSSGHARFQSNWRGLEAPRHLVLFNRDSLMQALTEAGFSSPRERPSPSASAGMFKKSFAMEQGYSPYDDIALPLALRWQAVTAMWMEALRPKRREFLTVSAQK